VLPNPHDALFHAAFSHRENAAAELRAVLPAELVARIDWSTLELTDGHYVDESLVSRQSDLLYTADLGGSPVALYVLVEHQSTADALMAFRMLRYLVRIWDKWLADREKAGERPKALPPIVLVLLAHAEGGWTAPVSMQGLYALPADLLPAVEAGRGAGPSGALALASRPRRRRSSAAVGRMERRVAVRLAGP
jgi:Putative transposase, YhgA-like